MPSLARFTLRLAYFGALAGAAIFALAEFVHPVPRRIEVTIPIDLRTMAIRQPDGSLTTPARNTRADDPGHLAQLLEARRLSP